MNKNELRPIKYYDRKNQFEKIDTSKMKDGWLLETIKRQKMFSFSPDEVCIAIIEDIDGIVREVLLTDLIFQDRSK